MRSTKKNQQSGGQAEIIAAVKALASEKDISEEMLYNAIEEALKAAYKKNVSREENAPTNLSVTLDRTTGVAQVFARKTITDEVEDPANQISLEDALKIRSDYRMGDIAEIDVTPTGFLRTAAQTAKQVIMQRIREAEARSTTNIPKRKMKSSPPSSSVWSPRACMWNWDAPRAFCPTASGCPERNTILTTISRSMYWRSTAPDAKCCAARRCASAASIPVW